MDTAKLTKKYILWSKVRDYRSHGFNITRTAQLLGISRNTVKRLQSIDDCGLLSECDSSRRYKLHSYEGVIRSFLTHFPSIPISRIHDHLKSSYPGFPHICEKTLHNFIQFVRKKYNISPAR